MGWIIFILFAAYYAVVCYYDRMVSAAVQGLRAVGLMPRPTFSTWQAALLLDSVLWPEGIEIYPDNIEILEFPTEYRLIHSHGPRGPNYFMRVHAFTGRILEARGSLWKRTGYQWPRGDLSVNGD